MVIHGKVKKLFKYVGSICFSSSSFWGLMAQAYLIGWLVDCCWSLFWFVEILQKLNWPMFVLHMKVGVQTWNHHNGAKLGITDSTQWFIE
jgi:hypothetical protein